MEIIQFKILEAEYSRLGSPLDLTLSQSFMEADVTQMGKVVEELPEREKPRELQGSDLLLLTA